jgi:hypothetical protein
MLTLALLAIPIGVVLAAIDHRLSARYGYLGIAAIVLLCAGVGWPLLANPGADGIGVAFMLIVAVTALVGGGLGYGLTRLALSRRQRARSGLTS